MPLVLLTNKIWIRMEVISRLRITLNQLIGATLLPTFRIAYQVNLQLSTSTLTESSLLQTNSMVVWPQTASGTTTLPMAKLWKIILVWPSRYVPRLRHPATTRSIRMSNSSLRSIVATPIFFHRAVLADRLEALTDHSSTQVSMQPLQMVRQLDPLIKRDLLAVFSLLPRVWIKQQTSSAIYLHQLTTKIKTTRLQQQLAITQCCLHRQISLAKRPLISARLKTIESVQKVTFQQKSTEVMTASNETFRN